MKLYDCINNYMNYINLYGSPGYVAYTKQHIYDLKKYFIDIDVESLNLASVILYIENCRYNQLSNNTINKRVAILKRVLKHNHIKSDIFEIKKLKEPFKTYGLVDESIDLIKVIEGLSLKNKCIISLFYDTGIRSNELIHLYTKNLDLKNRSWYVEVTKTNQPRTINFTNDTKKYLKEFIKSGRSGSIYFFEAEKTHTPLSRFSIQTIMNSIKKKYKIKNFSSHRIRHTFATEMYKKSGDINFVCDLLGHANVGITKRYIHTSKLDQLNKYDKYKNSR